MVELVRSISAAGFPPMIDYQSVEGKQNSTTSITDLSIASNNPQSYWHLLASCQGRLNMLDCPYEPINKSIKSTVSPISLYFEYHNENFSKDLDFVILGDQSLMGAFNNIEEF